MPFAKIETSDGETRWINLDQVARVTSATDGVSGHDIVAVIFSDQCEETTFRIRGDNPSDQAAIDALRICLDAQTTFSKTSHPGAP